MRSIKQFMPGAVALFQVQAPLAQNGSSGLAVKRDVYQIVNPGQDHCQREASCQHDDDNSGQGCREFERFGQVVDQLDQHKGSRSIHCDYMNHTPPFQLLPELRKILPGFHDQQQSDLLQYNWFRPVNQIPCFSDCARAHVSRRW